MQNNNKLITLNNIVYVLVDILETNLMDLECEYRKLGKCLRQDAKRNFNKAIHAIRCIKRDVSKCSEQDQKDFGNDADTINALLLTLIDRVGSDDMLLYKIYENIKSMPSKLELGIDLDDAFSYLFDNNERKTNTQVD